MNNDLHLPLPSTNRSGPHSNCYSSVAATEPLAATAVPSPHQSQPQSQLQHHHLHPPTQLLKKNSASTASTISNDMDRENRHSRDLMDRRITPRGDATDLLQSNTSSNSTTPSNRDANGYRSASESRGKRFSRVNSDLLQTALNHNFKLTKSSSSHSLVNQQDNKNIPMNPQELQLHLQLQMQMQQQQQQLQSNRPHMKRWNSYNISRTKDDPIINHNTNNDNQDIQHQYGNYQPSNLHPAVPLQQQQKSSISPLTVLKDEYNTKRPPITPSSSTLFNTDNSFQNLVDKPETDVNSHTNPANASPSKSTKLYQKINHIINIAHNSMHSLVPMISTKEGEVDDVGGDMENVTTINAISRLSNYQSESDDGSDDDDTATSHRLKNQTNDMVDESLQNTDTQYRLDSWKSPTLVDNVTVNPNDVNDIIEEINDFQNNFVYKYNIGNPNSNQEPYPESNERINRTQQKLLDYKELYSTDEFLNRESTSSTSSSAALAALNIENSYDLKIQNETILTQYNSIRLRFPTKIVSSGKSKAGTATTTATTGVLGYLNRYKQVIANTNQKSLVDKVNDISFADKDDILRNMWENESKSFFQTESANGGVKLMP